MNNSHAALATAETATLEAQTMRRVQWRLMPFLIVAYLASVIDRGNIGFASLQMNADIGLSHTLFGLAGGVFFISYFFCEIPSNMALERFGARRWIARVMISWGLVAGAMAFVAGPNSFLALRFVLGAAEAGFFPGVILYLTYWFPARYRARMIGIFMVSIPAANALGSPLAGMLLQTDGIAGLRGWQWLFLAEGVPTVLLGVVALFWLTDSPSIAHWLPQRGREWLSDTLMQEARARSLLLAHKPSLWSTLCDRRILLLTLISAATTTASTALAIWQPLIIKSLGLNYLQTGLVSAIPYVAASLAMVFWARSSDRSGERIWHNAIPMIIVIVGFVGMLLVHALWPVVTLLTVVMVGTYACKGPFWSMATEWLPLPVAAVGIAQISALANLSGFFASWSIGAIRDATGSFLLALLPLLGLCVLGTLAMIWLGVSGSIKPPRG
jgi:ACS family tartrate transporter-like MFS transporter